MAWPAASTIGEMLEREGLSDGARNGAGPPYTQPFAAASEPNRVWCADFKGWFRTGDGERIDPLTMTDAHSRYLLRCQAVEKTDTERVQAIFEAAFREYGMPQAIRTDNGAPFASRHRRDVAPIAVVDEAGHPAGADRGRASGTEWASRAHASHVEAGDGHAAGSQPAGAAASL